ncbi:hypothetical protein QYE76_049363 [Lolium multiflorum]|uniref:CCHC-type domain-containing protein n=1 Tax=Lolium multiflorum TaxID=4521 RepID=A0AAD8SP23_LOLMU|nr:hypothetical protein QYE76_049363 [Lolium multiflorum]
MGIWPVDRPRARPRPAAGAPSGLAGFRPGPSFRWLGLTAPRPTRALLSLPPAPYWAARAPACSPDRASPAASSRAPLARRCAALSCPPGCTCISTNHVEEIKELEAQVISLKKDLEKRHEGKSTLDKMLSVQQSPNDKSGLGFNSNNKNKSKSKNNKKKGQDKVKDPAKLVCFKCKVEGHHVRSCPLKKKKHLSEKQQGKRPQGQGQAHARPQVEDRPLPKKNQDVVPQEKKSIKKRKGNTCYLCRVKGHFASSCLSGTLSNPIIVDDDYSLGKDKDGNVFAKFVGTQSGLKKRTIWVAKPIVTNFLGPNLVGDQQAQT